MIALTQRDWNVGRRIFVVRNSKNIVEPREWRVRINDQICRERRMDTVQRFERAPSAAIFGNAAVSKSSTGELDGQRK